MPPKPKYTKDEIVDAAFELTQERGFGAVTAREVGKRLGTSVAPIFTVCNSMEELREAVRRLARQKYQEYMADIFDYTPAFKEFGIRWVSFAAEEPNLYRLLFLSQRDKHGPYLRFRQEFESILAPLVEEIVKAFGLSERDAEELLNQMIIFANGIAAFVINDTDSFSSETVSHDLSQVCIGIVLTDKLRDGAIDMATAKKMADSCESGITPRKKSGATP